MSYPICAIPSVFIYIVLANILSVIADPRQLVLLVMRLHRMPRLELSLARSRAESYHIRQTLGKTADNKRQHLPTKLAIHHETLNRQGVFVCILPSERVTE